MESSSWSLREFCALVLDSVGGNRHHLVTVITELFPQSFLVVFFPGKKWNERLLWTEKHSHADTEDTLGETAVH